MSGPTNYERKRYEDLKRAIADIGLIRRGSLVRRFMPCGKPGCRCQTDPPQLHGPYYQWTRKVRGKTVTVRLSEAEARLFAEWIGNDRRLRKILAQMERVSLKATERLRKAGQKS